jgi:hypothetical protein
MLIFIIKLLNFYNLDGLIHIYYSYSLLRTKEVQNKSISVYSLYK